MDKQEWATRLRTFIHARREALPLPERSNLTAEQEAECQIIGGETLSWNQDELQNIIKQRKFLRVIPFDQEPLIVCTSSMAGLVALQEIVPDPPDFLFSLLQTEFHEWNRLVTDEAKGRNHRYRFEEAHGERIIELPDATVEKATSTTNNEPDLTDELYGYISDDDDYEEPEQMFSMHHWSYFERLSEEDQIRAMGEFSEITVDEFRLHVIGDLWGPLCGSESGHLWWWDGQHMLLLKQGFSQSIY